MQQASFVSTTIAVCVYSCQNLSLPLRHLSPQLTSSVCTADIICLYNCHHMSLELSSSVSVAVIICLYNVICLYTCLTGCHLQSLPLRHHRLLSVSAAVITCLYSCHHLTLQLVSFVFSAQRVDSVPGDPRVPHSQSQLSETPGCPCQVGPPPPPPVPGRAPPPTPDPPPQLAELT